jgi:hypothetical protein
MGIAFTLNSKISLGDTTQGLVRLRTVRFKIGRGKGELSAEVEGECGDGHDQVVEVELELLDAGGQTLGWLKGKGTIEENDRGTVKAKQWLDQEQLSRITQFRLTFQTRPD